LVINQKGMNGLVLLSIDGAEAQSLTNAIDIRGAPSWSPDAKWIAVGGDDRSGDGLFRIPVGGGPAVRLVNGKAFDPVWSPDGAMIVYAGATIANKQSLAAVSPSGAHVDFPTISVYFDVNGGRYRFLPSGTALIYMQGSEPWQDFWLLDLETRK